MMRISLQKRLRSARQSHFRQLFVSALITFPQQNKFPACSFLSLPSDYSRPDYGPSPLYHALMLTWTLWACNTLYISCIICVGSMAEVVFMLHVNLSDLGFMPPLGPVPGPPPLNEVVSSLQNGPCITPECKLHTVRHQYVFHGIGVKCEMK